MPNEKRTKGSVTRATWISLLCAALLLVAGVGSVFSYVIINGSSPETPKQIVETFIPGTVDCKVTCETMTEGDYSYQFTVKNVGEIDAYVRVAVIFNWKDSAGNIRTEKPDMTGCIESQGEDWEKSDEYFYYLDKISPNGSTASIYIKEPESAPPADGCTFNVAVIAEGIQAEGVDANAVPAIDDAWGKDKVTFSIDPGTKRLTVTKKENP